MKQENTQPLWKVLNEARTQGEVRIIEPDEIAMEFTGMVIDGEFNAPKNIIKKKVIAEFPDLRGDAYEDIREQQTANAAYTALAVNEFANTVELLYICYHFFEHQEGDIYTNKIKTKILELCPDIRQTLNTIRQQLEKIS